MASHLAVSVWSEQASILEIKFLLISCINVIQSLETSANSAGVCLLNKCSWPITEERSGLQIAFYLFTLWSFSCNSHLCNIQVTLN